MKPFDLEAAKRGEPILTRRGCPATFIAHVPEADPEDRVVVRVGRGVYTCTERGSYFSGSIEAYRDLFMAPRKRTVWVNLYLRGEADYSVTEGLADLKAQNHSGRLGGRAHPIEIED